MSFTCSLLCPFKLNVHIQSTYCLGKEALICVGKDLSIEQKYPFVACFCDKRQSRKCILRKLYRVSKDSEKKDDLEKNTNQMQA